MIESIGNGLYVADFGNGPHVFFNSTPHAINLRPDAELNPAIRKWVGGNELAAIPPSGILLSARLANHTIADLGGGITVAEQVVESCDPLPEAARRADFIICSAMHGTGYRALHGQDGTRLLTIRDLVVDGTMRPIGCVGFATI